MVFLVSAVCVGRKTIADWRRNPYWISLRIGLMMTALAVVAIGGQVLLLGWAIAEATARWSQEPALRALAGVGLLAAVGALVWAVKRLGRQAQALEFDGSASARDERTSHSGH